MGLLFQRVGALPSYWNYEWLSSSNQKKIETIVKAKSKIKCVRLNLKDRNILLEEFKTVFVSRNGNFQDKQKLQTTTEQSWSRIDAIERKIYKDLWAPQKSHHQCKKNKTIRQ